MLRGLLPVRIHVAFTVYRLGSGLGGGEGAPPQNSPYPCKYYTMNILLWIIFGGIAGWIASLFVDADAQYGLIGNIVVGIVGAFIGGWIADKVGMGGGEGVERPTSIMSFVWAVVGAVILLIILNLIWF